MTFVLSFTDEATAALQQLRADAGRAVACKAVEKALGLLETNPNHSGLNVHPWKGKTCPHDKTLFEAYAQNNTPGAYRIFFCYVPGQRGQMLIVAITPHP